MRVLAPLRIATEPTVYPQADTERTFPLEQLLKLIAQEVLCLVGVHVIHVTVTPYARLITAA